MVKRTLRLIVAAATMAVFVSPAVAADPGVTANSVKIGGFSALTGQIAAFSKYMMDAIEIEFTEANQAGGVHGRKIIYSREDDRCDPATAIGAVKKLIHQDKVFMLHGGTCSNAALAARPTVEEAKIPWLILAAIADELTVPVSPYIYSGALTASVESYAQVEFARQRGLKRIAIVAQRDAWGRSRYEPLKEALRRAGITAVVDEEIAGDANDATPQALRIKNADADGVLLLAYQKPGTVLLRTLAQLGHKPTIVGTTMFGDLETLDKQIGIPGATDRTFGISHVGTTLDSELVKSLERRLHKYHPNDKFSIWHLVGFGSGRIVLEVLRRAGPDLSRERVLQEFAKLNDFDTGIFPGHTACSATDHQCHKTPAWVGLVNGRAKIIGTTEVSR